MENFYSLLRSILSELPHDAKRIVIVGKGPTIGQLKNELFCESIVINVNDSEIFQKGHFTLFHSERVFNSLKNNGFKNKYYITSYNISNEFSRKLTTIPVNFLPIADESAEHITEYFSSLDFIISEFLLLSALKLAHIINQELNTKLPIYLVGFDFSFDSKIESNDDSMHDKNYKEVLLLTQKGFYKSIINHLRNKLNLDVIHVGNSDVSDISPEKFIFQLFKFESISKPKFFNNNEAYETLIKKSENSNYTLVVAELTNNHIGQKDRLIKMIKASKESGADMIKVQKRDINTFYSSEELQMEYKSPFGTTLEEYRRGVELDNELMDVLVDQCQKSEICWFASILDYPSLEFMKPYDLPLIKLPSTISNHRNFLKKVGLDFNGDLVISTGFTDKEYEEFILSNFIQNRRLFLLQCTSSYPAPPEACQISVVRNYDELRVIRQLPNLYPGYSSHDLGSLGSMMAVAAGAKMVEKHVKLGNLDWIHFDGVALDLEKKEFQDFVFDIRKANLMCGSKIKKIHNQEHHKYLPNEIHN